MRDTPFPSSSEGTRPYYENQQLKRSELVFEKKKKKKRSKHVTAGAGKTKRFSIVRKKESDPRKLQMLIAISMILLILFGIAAAIVFLWADPLSKGPCDLSDDASEYQLLLCERASDGIKCDFDSSGCRDGCILGYEQDVYGCAKSCECATQGSFENDVAFNPNNIQSVLSAYLKDEDMTFDLAGGSVSIQSNIWDLDIVNGRVQIPYLMSNAISESVLSY
ncbi:unnamed protein product [Clavelina lepadiformis]|uniref:Uncharacterized protein n=1 Tax=Clavelina lepadiformis TaxID=159417 RepID=A0ABP0FJK9_CLALP